MKTMCNELSTIYTDEEINKQAEIDEAIMNEAWRAAEERLCSFCSTELAQRIISELKGLYSIYNKSAVEWYAELYDPKIGGYYYSNSARDNKYVEYNKKKYRLLPDLESTSQAMGVIGLSHMADKFNGNIAQALPEWMKEKMVYFVKNMQDEKSGYFYHPQWGKELTDKWINRRGRDLTCATRILNRYGETPLYKTPLEDRSKDKKSEKASTAPHLKDKDSFQIYLNSLEFDVQNAHSAYKVGSVLESQATELVARDKELQKEGADYRLLSILKEWLDARFNSENGTWTKAPLCHDSCNGILKICNAYARAGLTLPDPIKSLETVMECITLKDEPLHICCILNPWYAMSTLIGCIRAYGSNDGGASKLLSEIRERVYPKLPEMINKTANNLKLFVKPDGSFSFFKNRSADLSQDMPVAIPKTNEGDVNSTMICTTAIPNHICSYLGIREIPVYTESDRMRYINVLERNRLKA